MGTVDTSFNLQEELRIRILEYGARTGAHSLHMWKDIEKQERACFIEEQVDCAAHIFLEQPTEDQRSALRDYYHIRLMGITTDFPWKTMGPYL